MSSAANTENNNMPATTAAATNQDVINAMTATRKTFAMVLQRLADIEAKVDAAIIATNAATSLRYRQYEEEKIRRRERPY
jgi:hypothetical protein